MYPFAEVKSKERVLGILSFHKVGEPPAGSWPTWFYIPETLFASQLTYLQKHGWQVIDCSTFLMSLDTPDILPTRAVLLTFDDGYRSMRDVVLPWLLRFGYPAVLFVPSDYIGQYNVFDAGMEPKEPICDWDDLRELQRHGVAVQSHGASHRCFSNLRIGELEEELRRSKAVLENGLGRDVDVLAYPYGDGGADAQAVRRALQHAGYRAACLYKGGATLLPITDRYRLGRVPMGPDTDLHAALRVSLPDEGS
jgi:peptidoglycan/xylan/chitin deacetylase (PgdA/CDA1 family)